MGCEGICILEVQMAQASSPAALSAKWGWGQYPIHKLLCGLSFWARHIPGSCQGNCMCESVRILRWLIQPFSSGYRYIIYACTLYYSACCTECAKPWSFAAAEGCIDCLVRIEGWHFGPQIAWKDIIDFPPLSDRPKMNPKNLRTPLYLK